MRPRAALRTSAVAVALSAPLLGGCGVIFNGTASHVDVRSPTPGAEIIVNGGLAGKGSASFTTSYKLEPQQVTVRAPGHKPQTIVLERHVSVAAVVCDVLWSFTIIGVAAPISDAILDSFSYLGPSTIDVRLEPAASAPTTAAAPAASEPPPAAP